MRKQLTYANVVSSIALFVVLGGGAYAAATLPKNSVGSMQIKSNAVTSSKVKDGSLLSKDFKPGQLVAGAAGATGATGATGPKGDAGPKGDKGADFTADTTLASGKTLTGQWGTFGTATANGGSLSDVVNYRLPLAATPAANSAHYITTPAYTTQCPGVGQAAAGHLCIYSIASAGATFSGIYGIEPGTTGGGRGAKDGFQISFNTTGTGGAWSYGAWAMTAP
jgi:hypothetical protein